MLFRAISSYRRLIFLVIIGIASFIFFGLFLPVILSTTPVRLDHFSRRATPTVGPSRAPIIIEGKDVIQLSLSQIETFRLNSIYAIALHCLKQKAEISEGKKNSDNKGAFVNTAALGRCDRSAYRTVVSPYLIVLLDRFSEITRENSYRLQADEAFADLVRHCNVDERACLEAFPALVWRYRQTADDSLLSLLGSAGEQLFDSSTRSIPAKILEIDKLVTLYQLTGDLSFIAVAEARLDTLRQWWKKQPSNETPEEGEDPIIAMGEEEEPIRRYDCGRFWVTAELAQITGDSVQFGKARQFFSGVEKFSSSIGHIGALTMCLEGLSFFERTTGEIQFRQIARKLVQDALTSYWDSAHDPKFTGDYGFLLLDYWESETNRMLNFKYFNESVWFLTQMIPFSKAVLQF